MHTPPSLPAGLRRRLLGIAMALPLIAVGIVAAPVSATTSTSAADTGITVEGRYNAAGAGCHGSDNADGCLSWRVRVPSTVAPNASTTVTIEADSVPGQWTWTCPSPDGDRVAGTSAFYIDKGKDEPASERAALLPASVFVCESVPFLDRYAVTVFFQRVVTSWGRRDRRYGDRPGSSKCFHVIGR